MTPRELREMLFQVENQSMTVEELRQFLFNLESQDDEMRLQDLANGTRLAYLKEKTGGSGLKLIKLI